MKKAKRKMNRTTKKLITFIRKMLRENHTDAHIILVLNDIEMLTLRGHKWTEENFTYFVKYHNLSRPAPTPRKAVSWCADQAAQSLLPFEVKPKEYKKGKIANPHFSGNIEPEKCPSRVMGYLFVSAITSAFWVMVFVLWLYSK